MTEIDEAEELNCQQRRKTLLKRIEKLRSSRVVACVAQAPLDDSVLLPLYLELRNFGRVERLDLVLHSFGGNIDTPYKVVKLIRDYCEYFSVIIPVAAKSAASMIALGADQIVMGPFAELGPIDPVVRHPVYSDMWISVQSLQYYHDYVSEKRQTIQAFERIDPWFFGDYAKTIKASQQYAEALLKEYMLKEQKETVRVLVDKLINGYYSHGYPITKSEAKALGLNIAETSCELSDAILELFLEYERLYRLI